MTEFVSSFCIPQWNEVYSFVETSAISVENEEKVTFTFGCYLSAQAQSAESIKRADKRYRSLLETVKREEDSRSQQVPWHCKLPLRLHPSAPDNHSGQPHPRKC